MALALPAKRGKGVFIMKVYLVSFPDDIPILKRVRRKGKREILLSYFFLRESRPLPQVLTEAGFLKKSKSKEEKNENQQGGITNGIRKG
jgi:hypothetical protein